MTDWIQNLNVRERFNLTLVLALALLVSFSGLRTPLIGEDEMMFLNNSHKVVKFLGNGDPSLLRIGILEATNPPASSLFPAPFVLAFGKSYVVFRIPHVLLWSLASLVTYAMGRILAGPTAGFYSGILTGGSGMFALNANANAHGFFTFWLLIFVWRHLRGGIPDCRTREGRLIFTQAHGCLFLAFLAFNNAAAIVALYSVAAGWKLWNSGAYRLSDWRGWIQLNLLFVSIYIVYYLLFVGLPWYWYQTGFYSQPMGFHARTMSRLEAAYLNLRSFWLNLKGINAYFLPGISIGIFLLGLIAMIRKAPGMAFALSAHLFTACFYLSDPTIPHFLPVFAVLLPFSIAALFRFRIVLLFLTAAVFTWTYTLHLKRYTDETWPHALMEATHSQLYTRANLDRPLETIASDLHRLLPPNAKCFSLADGAIHYYFNDPRMTASPALVQDTDGTWIFRDLQDLKTYRMAVTFTHRPFHPSLIQKTLTYPGSHLTLVEFRTFP